MGGFHHPLPFDEEREHDHQNQIKDNYLYKTYSCESKYYPKGAWVLDIRKYKTVKFYGSQSIVIKDRRFDDGTCLYDYIEHYLYGLWRPEPEGNLSQYAWWEEALLNRFGQWLMAGRAEFTPQDLFQVDNREESKTYSWGFFFIKPQAGNCYNSSEYPTFISNAAHSCIGKRITPQLVRHMWATWSFQVRLTDAQIESLAYGMGHDVNTLRELYDYCSPEEKRRPIEEAIDILLSLELKPSSRIELTTNLNNLAEELSRLPVEERESMLQKYLGNV